MYYLAPVMATSGKNLCAFCNEEVDADVVGEMLSNEDLLVHQYCLVRLKIQVNGLIYS